MRYLMAVFLVATLGWSAYWWIGARNADRDAITWLEARHDAGWVANVEDVKTRGYPNRFDTTLTNLELADPKTGLAWTAPFFQALRLSYQPGHIIAIWPKDQSISTPNQNISVKTETARASMVFEPKDNWVLLRSNMVADGIELRSNAGWSAELADLRLATRTSTRIPGAVDIGFEVQDLRPANAALAKLAEMNLVPSVMDSIKIDASVTFDAPLDSQVIENARPNISAIDLHVLQTRWGQLDLWMAGELNFDDQGYATGRITIKAKNWREILQLFVATGWLPDSVVDPLESGLGLLATLSGSKETLDTPLTIKDGAVSFGPIPLGRLSPLRIR